MRMFNEPRRQRIEWHPVTRYHKGRNKADEKPAAFLANFAVCKITFSLNVNVAVCHQAVSRTRHADCFSPEQRLSYRIEISAPHEGDTPFTFSGAVWPKRMQAETAAGNAIDEDGNTHRFRIKERKPFRMI